MGHIIDDLLEKYKERYQKAITHALTKELCEGTLPDFKLFTYLTQDLKFFQLGMNVFGKTLAYCDNTDSAIILSKQIGFIANDENDYFDNCLTQLKETSKPELEQHCCKMLLGPDSPVLPLVEKYLQYLKHLAHESLSYVEIITFMYLMEQVYLGWADFHILKGNVREDLPYKYKEWIILHSGDKFTSWVEFLKREVNRAVVSQDDRSLCEEAFLMALNLEIAFFDSCYSYKE
jgi:thiaminase